jgi:hypothetical protein
MSLYSDIVFFSFFARIFYSFAKTFHPNKGGQLYEAFPFRSMLPGIKLESAYLKNKLFKKPTFHYLPRRRLTFAE